MKRALTVAALLATGAVALLPSHGAAATTTTTDWKHLSPATSPTSRFYIRNMMAYDAATSQLILFGGEGIGPSNETWLWNGTTWTLLSPATSPPARAGANLAFDAASNQLILFGGKGLSATPLSDTWAWNGTTWTNLNPATTPTNRAGAMMAYDPVSSKLVLFGGASTSSLSFINSTYTWNGTDWTLVTTLPANTPSARWASGIATDSTSGQVILFGGQGNSGALADTWVWNGTGWNQLSPAASPSTRVAPALSDDPLLSGLVLFGGSHNGASQNDTWTWNGSTWTLLTTATTPPARDTGSLAFDTAASQLILFGGETLTVGGAGGSILGDTWNLSTITTTVIPVPAAGAGLPLLAILLVALGGAVLVGTKRIGTRRAAR